MVEGGDGAYVGDGSADVAEGGTAGGWNGGGPQERCCRSVIALRLPVPRPAVREGRAGVVLCWLHAIWALTHRRPGCGWRAGARQVHAHRYGGGVDEAATTGEAATSHDRD